MTWMVITGRRMEVCKSTDKRRRVMNSPITPLYIYVWTLCIPLVQNRAFSALQLHVLQRLWCGRSVVTESVNNLPPRARFAE